MGEPNPLRGRTGEGATAGEATDDAEVGNLLTRLVHRVRARSGEGGGEIAGQAVLLDIEHDGVRCLLLDAERTASARILSPREQEIVRMVAKGYPDKTIAAVLEISKWTVSTYLRRIYSKLGVRSRAAMVACVIEDRLLLDSIAPERDVDPMWRDAAAPHAPPEETEAATEPDDVPHRSR